MAIKTEAHLVTQNKAKTSGKKHLLFPRGGYIWWAEAGCVHWLS